MKKNVMVIDDEKTILIAFKKLLECPGVEVDTAETLEDAETLLNERSYDAVIADLRLSGISGEEGLDIIRYVKTRYPESHVILITAYGSPEVMKKAYSLGAAYYFEKPVSTHVLKDALKNLGVIFKTAWG
jgi:DNA-binding NtrC family response regulator